MVPLPRVTVITPSLNQAAFIERTIRSVLDQGYGNLEYMVIDGGSTDGTTDILERYSDRLAYWVSEADRGQAHAINKGIARATGDLVTYINSDDFHLPGAVQALAEPLSSDPSIVWSVGVCRYENPDGSLERLWFPDRPPRPRRQIVESGWYVPQASSLWRRDVFDRHGLLREDLHYVFDTEFTVRLALAGVVPHPVRAEVAVRYLQDEAKSATPERFEEEWENVKRELRGRLAWSDHAAYMASRLGSRVGGRHRDAGTIR